MSDYYLHNNGVIRDTTACPGEGAYCNPRPILVIDPEDREQVGALADRYVSHFGGTDSGVIVDALQDALRSLITPPKPPEPRGLGAVVQSHTGHLYIRHGSGPAAWMLAGASPDNRDTYPYGQIDAVEVLSEGVPA